MPSTYLSKKSHDEARLAEADLKQRAELRLLVARYEAVRQHHGPEHDEAERLLGIALARYGQFNDNGLAWQWSSCQDSITRGKAQTSNLHGGKKKCLSNDAT
jgi:hypothetical protein